MQIHYLLSFYVILNASAIMVSWPIIATHSSNKALSYPLIQKTNVAKEWLTKPVYDINLT
jgi:hypothetical protein